MASIDVAEFSPKQKIRINLFWIVLSFGLTTAIAFLIIGLSVPLYGSFASSSYVAWAWFAIGQIAIGFYASATNIALGWVVCSTWIGVGVFSIAPISIGPFGFGIINLNVWGLGFSGICLIRHYKINLFQVSRLDSYTALATTDPKEKVDVLPRPAPTTIIASTNMTVSFPKKADPPRNINLFE